MRTVNAISISELEHIPQADERAADRLLGAELARCTRKVIALDDDPTGIQTVHGVYVYTTWDEDAFLEGFRDPNRLFFIMTNSRGMTAEETAHVHREMAEHIVNAAAVAGRDYILISRSDSTLRGHYPLETAVLRQEIEKRSSRRFDGEIIVPFFKEGGRFTMNNIHYVREGNRLTPAGMTEFAKDRSFGYTASHLGDWVEEKTQGAYRGEDVTFISLDSLRALDVDTIVKQLMAVRDFQKVVVNAIDYVDVKVFSAACLRAMEAGKEFMFRSAAAVTKVLGGVPDSPLLEREQLIQDGEHGGIVIIGSHVNRTTRQLEELMKSPAQIAFIEFNQHLVLEDGGLEREALRVSSLAEEAVASGRSAVVYTRRERLDINNGNGDQQLRISVRISNALTSVIGQMRVQPSFIVAKGGITSSDVGTKALRVRRAEAMGQIQPGIPVWMTGVESKFPCMPYIIFPGNVGGDSTLREIVETLAGFSAV